MEQTRSEPALSPKLDTAFLSAANIEELAALSNSPATPVISMPSPAHSQAFSHSTKDGNDGATEITAIELASSTQSLAQKETISAIAKEIKAEDIKRKCTESKPLDISRPIISWPKTESILWRPMENLQNPLARLDRLAPELIDRIMHFTQNRAANTCLGLTCSALWTVHFARNGPSRLDEISPIWVENIDSDWDSARAWFRPSTIRCYALHKLIREFMGPGMVYDRHRGLFRKTGVMREEARREAEIRPIAAEPPPGIPYFFNDTNSDCRAGDIFYFVPMLYD
ncbi:uncharacterized protein L3040_006367 [Drepanopeziza brunnea f. sp. 'multigermtubi']|uniref:Uncharacterized protein n=1 Tax=Marssonina brunnea f. sp. multigermtubi (strain MB_m1) TaxID=1072389 RepID=K1X6B7_MARBU|nr:uncharacterized protein MBM_01324 [Drepanopeziza brunnea f. sp. 'multigermtubi' MB_m1]EKD20642.1 hypothetical protein MBM_01324 [Drepanopeziza brunnea f. sp. 'multigermtubi' MB_m1]KAJ5038687.1 hypothetical protein L3040_006367 [Drepanopeziza brunnea f. sp. 'multigermtubi']